MIIQIRTAEMGEREFADFESLSVIVNFDSRNFVQYC